ncbi:MAG: hypothetical protein JOZ51_12795 [Chloroflexi bacterium]|nr:hypothetical protein [Chloroflexota bacterium]
MAAEQRAGITYQSAGLAHEAQQQIADRVLQRRAMGSMLLAMLVMLLGLPLHLPSLSAHGDHSGAARLLVWLSALLTLWTLWITRHVFGNAWLRLRRRDFGAAELVSVCALAAFVASLPALLVHRTPMYFDVSAMALAWLVAGEAQTSAIQRRFVSACEQLVPLRFQPQMVSVPAVPRGDRTARWLGLTILVFSISVVSVQILRGGSGMSALLAGLSAVAVGCPCTLGIARSSAWEAGVERAAVLGWLLPSGAALGQIAADPQLVKEYALKLGAADHAALMALAQLVERTIRWNYLSAIGLNLALLPLALFGPPPSLLPAATMVLARLLIAWTTRTLRLPGSGTIAMMR